MSHAQKNLAKLEKISTALKALQLNQNRDIFPFLVNDLEKLTRQEKSTFYAPYFKDENLASCLIAGVKAYEENTGVVRNVVSAIGNMVWRYGLNPSDELFDYFVRHKDTKTINFYVSLYISSFPQFKLSAFRWDYIISMPLIAPRVKSENNFYIEIKRIILSGEKIPATHKQKIIDLFLIFLQKATNDTYRARYNDILKELTKEE